MGVGIGSNRGVRVGQSDMSAKSSSSSSLISQVVGHSAGARRRRHSPSAEAAREIKFNACPLLTLQPHRLRTTIPTSTQNFLNADEMNTIVDSPPTSQMCG